jgi:uncharacterized protein YcbK (DUF882 family)
MTWSRRRLLNAGGALAAVSAAALLGATARSGAASAAGGGSPDTQPEGSPDAHGAGSPDTHGAGAKRIALMNLHTDERVDVEYFHGGAYVPDALAAIEKVLRDFRTGDRHAMDPALMDYLVDVAGAVGVGPSFSVISGYRSPQTNAQLRDRSTGVAQHSLHMEGRAIDVRIKGVDCASLAAHALDLKRGGVGYYRASDFVHLDTGPFRTWKG